MNKEHSRFERLKKKIRLTKEQGKQRAKDGED